MTGCASNAGIAVAGLFGLAGSILVGLAAADYICNKNTRKVLAVIGLILLALAFIMFTWYLYAINSFNMKQHKYLASMGTGYNENALLAVNL